MTLPPSSKRYSPLAADTDVLRDQLNKQLEHKDYEEAVKTARYLRDALLHEGNLDERGRKTLEGAESVLRRFDTQDESPSSRPRWVIWTLVGLIVLAGGIAGWKMRPSASYPTDARKALEALDQVDGAVSAGVGLRDYQAKVTAIRDQISSFTTRYGDSRRDDLSFVAISGAARIYEGALTEWQRGQGMADRNLSLGDKDSELPSRWRVAHVLQTLAGTVLGGPPPAPTASGPAARLAGHWSNEHRDVFLGPLNATGTGWAIARTDGVSTVSAYAVARAKGESLQIVHFDPSSGAPDPPVEAVVTAETLEEKGLDAPLRRAGDASLP